MKKIWKTIEPKNYVLKLNLTANDLICDSPSKRGQKERDMKCMLQNGISILEFCFPICSNSGVGAAGKNLDWD